MTPTIDLSPAEEVQLAAAARQNGLDPPALVRALVTKHLPAPAALPEDPTLPFFAQWAEEDAHKPTIEKS